MKPPIRPEADGSLRCPSCGSNQFQPVRSTGVKVGLGVFALAAQPKQLRCIVCGARYSPQPIGTTQAIPARPD